MPILPYHFGPGLLFRSMTPSVSFIAFAAVNSLIDSETLVSWLLTGQPRYGFLHSYLGATLIAVSIALFARKPLEYWLSWWNRRWSPTQLRWLGCKEEVSPLALWLGALLGAWLHIWLDALIITELEPGWPWVAGNPALSKMDLTLLHATGFAAGALGICVLTWQRFEALRPDIAALVNRWTGRIVGLGLLIILLMTGYFYYSLMTGKTRVSAICDQMTPGMPIEELVSCHASSVG